MRGWPAASGTLTYHTVPYICYRSHKLMYKKHKTVILSNTNDDSDIGECTEQCTGIYFTGDNLQDFFNLSISTDVNSRQSPFFNPLSFTGPNETDLLLSTGR